MVLLKRFQNNQTMKVAAEGIQRWMQAHDEKLTRKHWFTYVNMEKLDQPSTKADRFIRKPMVLTCALVAEVAIGTFELVKHFYELLAVICDKWEFKAFLTKVEDIINKTVDRLDILAYTTLKIVFHYTGDTSLKPLVFRQVQLRDIEALNCGKRAMLIDDKGSYRFEEDPRAEVITKDQVEQAIKRASHIEQDKPLRAGSFIRGKFHRIELSLDNFNDRDKLSALDSMQGQNLIDERRAITEGSAYTKRLRYLFDLSSDPVHLVVDPLSLWFVLELAETMDNFAEKLAVLEVKKGGGIRSKRVDDILAYLQKKAERNHSCFHHVFLMQVDTFPGQGKTVSIEKLRRKVFYCDRDGTVYSSEVRRLEKLMVDAHTQAYLQPAPCFKTQTERQRMGIVPLNPSCREHWISDTPLAQENVIELMGERAVPTRIFTWEPRVNLSYVNQEGFFGFYFESMDHFKNFCQAFKSLKDEGETFTLPCLFFKGLSQEEMGIINEKLNEHARDLGAEKVYFHVDSMDEEPTVSVQQLDALGLYSFKFSRDTHQIEPLSELPLLDLRAARSARATHDTSIEVSFFDDETIKEQPIEALVEAGDTLTVDEAVEMALSQTGFDESWRDMLRKLFESRSARKQQNVAPLAKRLDPLIKRCDEGKKRGRITLLTFEMLLELFEKNKTFKLQVDSLLKELAGAGDTLDARLHHVLENQAAFDTHIAHKMREQQDQINAIQSEAFNDAIAHAKLCQQGDDVNAGRWKINRQTKPVIAALQTQINAAKAKKSREQMGDALMPLYAEIARLRRISYQLSVLLRQVKYAPASQQQKMESFSEKALRVYSRFDLPIILPPSVALTEEVVSAINRAKPKAIYLFVDGTNLVHNLKQLKSIQLKGLKVTLLPSKDPEAFRVARKLAQQYRQVSIAPAEANLSMPPLAVYAKNSIDEAARAVQELKKSDMNLSYYVPAFNAPALTKLGLSVEPSMAEVNEIDGEDAGTVGTQSGDEDDDDGSGSIGNGRAPGEQEAVDASQLASTTEVNIEGMREEQLYFRYGPIGPAPKKGDWSYDAYKLLRVLKIPRDRGTAISTGGGLGE